MTNIYIFASCLSLTTHQCLLDCLPAYPVIFPPLFTSIRIFFTCFVFPCRVCCLPTYLPSIPPAMSAYRLSTPSTMPPYPLHHLPSLLQHFLSACLPARHVGMSVFLHHCTFISCREKYNSSFLNTVRIITLGTNLAYMTVLQIGTALYKFLGKNQSCSISHLPKKVKKINEGTRILAP